MRDEQKTKEELLKELKVLRRDLEQFEQAEHRKMNLGESEHLFRNIFESAADGILLADVETKKFYMGNYVICQMLGYDSQELTALNAMDIHPEQDAPHVMEQFDKQARGELTLAKDIPIKKKDGSVFYADVNAFSITLDEKAYLMGIFRDVSERKQAEKESRDSKYLLEQMFSSLDSAVFVLDNGNPPCIVDCNPATLRIFGYPKSQLIGQTTDILHANADSLLEFQKTLYPAIKTPGYLSFFEFRMKRSDGEIFPTEHSIRPLKNDKGDRIGWVSVVSDITERKRAEEAKTEHQTLIQGIMDNAGSIVTVRDLQGKYLMVNREVEKVLGMESEQIIGKTPYEIHSNDKANKILTDDKRVIEGRSLLEIEDQLDAQGETRIFLGTKFPLLNTAGDVYAVCTIATDITEHKQAMEEIRKFKTISDKAGHGVAIADLNGNLIYVNDSFAQMHQYNMDELIGQNLSIFHNEQQLERVNQLNHQLKCQGNYVAEEVWHKKRDNTVFPTLMSATLVRDENQEPLFMAATAIDITKHKKAEELLRYSEERYRSVVEDSPVLLCSFFPDGEITFVNTAYCRYFGKTREELIGNNFKYLIPEGDRQTVLDHVMSLTVDSPAMTHEHKVYAPDGQVRWQRWTNRALFDEHGRAVSFQAYGEDITDRKNIEESLKESELRYRTLFETLPVGVGLATLDGQIIDANSTMQRMMGRSLEEIKQSNVRDMYHNPDERTHLLKQLQQDGLVRDFEAELKRRDGSTYKADLNVTAMKIRNETVLVTVAKDITEQRNMERALAESEEKYRTLVESARDPIATIDEKGTYLFMNKIAAKRLTGKDEDLAGKTLWDFFPKEIADRHTANIRKVIETEQGANIVSLTTVQDQPRWYNTTIEPLRNDCGTVVAAIVIARDVDNIKRAEEQIQKLSSAVESAINGIAIGDAEGNLTYVNHALLEMWGYDNENEVLGRNAIEFWQTKEEGIKILETVKNKGSWIGQMTAKRKDGSTFDVQICATLVKDENGKPISMMGSFVDISETKRREEELSRYRGQMARAEQLASLGTLSATMAHQLTQPLTVIRLSMDNALDELEASSSSETVIRRLKDSVTQVSNITSIIERFRNFARKSSGRTVAEVNLKAVAVRIASLLSESARSANIALRIRNMDDLPCPLMNENDLEQLFFALIENAIQATDGKKGRQLTISGAMKDKHIELSISDDCSGIPPENIEKIFEPFFTTRPRGQGTGLGLCIVQDVVSRNGGRIRVESKIGKGTTFTIRLPFEQGKIS
jgi:PAS domain S-box-containing protein